MKRIEKTVFISYRRTDRWPALAVFKDLTQHGYDVFIDYEGIASGDFEEAILDNIRSRAHFVVLLTPTALERCDDPADWLRREIEAALEHARNVVPLLLDGFDFASPLAMQRIHGSLEPLRRYQAIRVPKEAEFFDAAMSLLRDKHLAVPLEAVLHPPSAHARRIAEEQRDAASNAAAPVPDGAQRSGGELSDLPSDIVDGASDLQRMLWVHLCTHWQQISVAPLFHAAEVIEQCLKPLTIRTVFNAVIESDCEDVLDGLRSCFDPSKSNQSQALLNRSSPAYEALTLIALVAAEQFVLAQRAALDDVCCAPHEPIPGQDRLLSAVVAAAIFRFGLRFKPENRLPVNVVYAKPPQAELGNRGEEGPALFRKELLATANRVEFGSEHDLTGIEDVSNRRLGRLVARVAQRLDCPVALRAEASGALSGSEARRSLLEDMGQIGVRAFFTPVVHDNQPPSIRNLYSDLKVLLTPFFFPTSAPTATEDQTMSKPGLPPQTPAGVINNFFGPVGDIAQANAQGASAAGRDVVQGMGEKNLIELLTALTRAVESHPDDAAREKDALLSYIGDIQGVVMKPTEQRTESEAKLVKRCLDGLKQGSEAIENGSTILEKLSPLWQGLKASWPALAALFS